MERKILDYAGLVQIFSIVKESDKKLESDVTQVLNGMAQALEQKADKSEIPTIPDLSDVEVESMTEDDIYDCVPPKVWVDLNNEWQPLTYSDANLDGYDVYESFKNSMIPELTTSKMRVYFSGYTNFNFKVRHDGYKSFSHIMVSNLDTEIPDGTSYSNKKFIAYNDHGTVKTWNDVSFECDKKKHFVEIIYERTSTNSVLVTAPDKGFIAIPK